MTLLLNSSGTPEPSPEIRRRLQGVHSKLDLKYVTHAASNWAVIMWWDNDDRRNEWIQNGQTDPARAFDIIGYLPIDCSPDEAPAYLGRMFRTFPRQNVSDLLNRLDQYNAAPAQKAAEEALADVLDMKDPSKASGPKVQVESAGVPEEKPAPKKAAPKKRAPRKKAAPKSKYLD